MKTPTRWLSAAAVATTVAMTAGLVAAAPAAQAVEVTQAYGLVDTPLGTDALVRFNTANPAALSTPTPITMLNPGERVLAIDFRPANGALYGITSDGLNNNRLVVIDPNTGRATPVTASDGTLTALDLPVGVGVGFDANPRADRFRVTAPGNPAVNARINPVNAVTDTQNATAFGDGTASRVTASAYTRNFAIPEATGTTLYAIDTTADALVTQDATSGVVTRVGSARLVSGDITDVNGFDIAAADDTAFAALRVAGQDSSGFYTVNLATGEATLRQRFASGTFLRGFTLALPGIVGFQDGAANDSNESEETFTVAENASSGGVTVTVVRSGGTEGDVTVEYATKDGTAVAGEDYTASTGSVRIPAGQTSGVFTVPVRDDSVIEGAETFTVSLTTVTGGAGFASTTVPAPPRTATVRITDSESGLLYGLTTNDQLVTFTVNSPGTATSRPISGLQTGETGVGLDLRPSDGRLYLVTNQSRIYTVDTAMASPAMPQATARLVGTISDPPVNGNNFGVDFNPVADRLRITSDNDQNLRVKADTPVTTTEDSRLSFLDAANPSITAVAYTNNLRGATGTTRLYGLDDAQDVLVVSDTPNAGVYQRVGRTTVNFTGINGFDIAGQGGLAVAALVPADSQTSTLYRVDLETGAASSLGAITVPGATPASPSTTVTLEGLTFGEVGTPEGQNPPKPTNPNPRSDTAVGRVTLDIGARNNTITAGNRPLLSGVVSDTAAQPRGIAGKQVQILQKVYNSNTFTLLTTVTTNASGRYELRVNPDRQRAYVARVSGPNGQVKQSDQDGQRQDVIFVNNRINVSAPAGGARIGRSTVVRGDLDPDFASVRIGVAILRNGRFGYITQGVTNSRGEFTIDVRNLPRGDYALVVYTSARQGTLAGSASRAVVVR